MKRIGLSMSRVGVLILVFSAPMCLSCVDNSHDRTVSVLYAGSLATVMENGLGPAFSKATGYEYKGEAQGSLGGARMIHDHLRTPDVFISADPSVNESVLMGSGNGDLVTWYFNLASAQLVARLQSEQQVRREFQAASAAYSMVSGPRDARRALRER